MTYRNIFAFSPPPRPRPREWIFIALVAVVAVVYLPIVVRRTVVHGYGDAQVFFRAGWAIWTGYPLYTVTDNHGWTYHYPPTFALLMGPFANPLPGYPQPAWAMPYVASITVWYILNFVCLVLSLHLWAGALERYASLQTRPGFWQDWWMLRLAPLLSLLPYAFGGLERGQPSPLLLLLIVIFLLLYLERRIVPASFALALGSAIKLFPIALALLPFLRRDWKFMFWSAGWGLMLLFGLPLVCLGPAVTFDLYRAMWSDHLAGIIGGSMSSSVASEVSPGAYATISVGATLARIAGGAAFYASPLPGWANGLQLLFNISVVAAIAVLGHGRFWSLRGTQPAAGYPLLIAGAVLFAAIPLMISVAKPNYVTFVLPLMAILLVEAWRQAGQQIASGRLVAWSVIAWLSVAALQLPVWTWIKVAGPMTWALLLLGPPSLRLLRTGGGRSNEIR